MDKNEEKLKQERAKRVRYIRERVLDFTRKEFQEQTKISSGTLLNWEGLRNHGLGESGARRFTKALQKLGVVCTAEWLLYGIGEAPAPVFVEKRLLPSTAEANITQELALFHQLYPDGIDSVINDASMLPHFWPGDRVAGQRYHDEDIKKVVGLPCIVELVNEVVMVRVVEVGGLMGRYNLACSNTAMSAGEQKDVKLLSAAPVIWIRRQFSTSR